MLDLKYLREERLKRGYNMRQFSEILEINYSYYKAIEINRKFPSLPLALKIINLLELDANKLFKVNHNQN